MATETSSRTTTTLMQAVYCVGFKKGHIRCNQPLFRVIEGERHALPASVQSKCPRCGTVYTLADYR